MNKQEQEAWNKMQDETNKVSEHPPLESLEENLKDLIEKHLNKEAKEQISKMAKESAARLLQSYGSNYLQVVDKNGDSLPQPEVTYTSTGHQGAYGIPQKEWNKYMQSAQSIDCNVKAPSVQSLLMELSEKTCKLDDVIASLYCKLNPLIEPTPVGDECEPLRGQSSPLVDQIRCIDDRVNGLIRKISWLIDNITI